MSSEYGGPFVVCDGEFGGHTCLLFAIDAFSYARVFTLHPSQKARENFTWDVYILLAGVLYLSRREKRGTLSKIHPQGELEKIYTRVKP